MFKKGEIFTLQKEICIYVDELDLVVDHKKGESFEIIEIVESLECEYLIKFLDKDLMHRVSDDSINFLLEPLD